MICSRVAFASRAIQQCIPASEYKTSGPPHISGSTRAHGCPLCRRRVKVKSRRRSMERTMEVQALGAHHGIHGRAGDTAFAFSPARPRLPGVEARLAYLAPTAERPYNYMHEPPAGIAQQNCEYRLCAVRISDGRAMASPPSIHHEGFEL